VKHEQATHSNCENMSCSICNLWVCSMCGGAEGSLTTDCPCYQVPYVMRQLVYAGAIDFVVDKWVTKDSMIEIDIRGKK